MLKGHDNEIGFIGLLLIIYYLVYGWDAALQFVLIIGGVIAFLVIGNLFFDLIDKLKKHKSKDKRQNAK